jgi:predicted TIM-barrel enzyme
MMSKSFIKEQLLASTVIGVIALATPAMAQELPEASPQTATAAVVEGADMDAIIVTGSRIARPDLSANSPISIVTGET